jgi:hypothetical protein
MLAPADPFVELGTSQSNTPAVFKCPNPDKADVFHASKMIGDGPENQTRLAVDKV